MKNTSYIYRRVYTRSKKSLVKNNDSNTIKDDKEYDKIEDIYSIYTMTIRTIT